MTRLPVTDQISIDEDELSESFVLASGPGGQNVNKVSSARSHRTQERNRADAREKLFALIRQAATPPKPRRPTRPTKASKRRRLDAKTARAKIKQTRGKVRED